MRSHKFGWLIIRTGIRYFRVEVRGYALVFQWPDKS